MKWSKRAGSFGSARPAKVLVLFSLMLPLFLGLVGLTVDGGLLMASHRQTQNSADAAAMTAAMELFRGSDHETALAQANLLIANNGLTGVALTLGGGGVNSLNIPPTQGPYAGDPQFVEAIVERKTPTSFIHILGVNQEQRVVARAVAGYEPVGSGEGAIVLDPNAVPGIAVNGNNTMLKVNGTVVVNSTGSGMDQYGNDVNGTEGIKTTQTPSIVAQEIQSVGGIDILNNIRRYDSSFPNDYNINDTDRPFFRIQNPVDDPLREVPTPSTSNSVAEKYWTQSPDGTLSFTPTKPARPNDWASVNFGNGDTRTLWPGIYKSISITGGDITFLEGIYVVGVDNSAGGNNSVLTINGGNVTGNGVMFYLTGSDYRSDGTPDSADGENPPGNTAPTRNNFTINGGNVDFSPYVNTTNPSDPFNNILFYMRRRNTGSPSVGGSTADGIKLTGTIYGKWSRFQISGQGRYHAQYIVGSLTIGGQAIVTIEATGKNFGRANQVFLVE